MLPNVIIRKKVSAMLTPDSPLMDVICIQSNECYIFSHPMENYRHIETWMAFQLRRLPGPEEVYEAGDEVMIMVWNHHFPMDKELLAFTQLLSAVAHVRFTRLLDLCQDKKHIFMIIPYMPGSDLDLYDRIVTRGHQMMSEDDTRHIVAEILGHLTFMKQCRIPHG